MGVQLTIRKLADRTAEPETVTTPGGGSEQRYPLAGVKIVGDPPATHAFRYAYLAQAAGEGWVSMSGDQVVIHTVDGDVTYGITGRWPSGGGVDVELVGTAGRKASTTRSRKG